jgi:uncharacterized protein (UPF0332 family)
LANEAAEESLASAVSEFANSRYDSCVNRCYYACYQAAVAALLIAGVIAVSGSDRGYAFIQAQFAGELIARRKVYPGTLRDVLARLMDLRHEADYSPVVISRTQAARALGRAQEFVLEVLSRGGNL